MEKTSNEILKAVIKDYRAARMFGNETPTTEVTIEFLQELLELRELEKYGLLVRLPFAVGDIVYLACEKVHPFEISEIRIDKFAIETRISYRGTEENKRHWEIRTSIERLGELFFLTRKEAEAALERMG